MLKFNINTPKIAIIGLGYVGLPLAFEFQKKFQVVGFDINKERIKELGNGYDRTGELNAGQLKSADNLLFSINENDLENIDCFIVTVPTPIDAFNRPDLNLLIQASTLVGKYLSKGNLVVFESTVFPGATEQECLPVLEKQSGLVCNDQFFLGYSPERINPGDKTNTITNIKKITSGSNEYAREIVDNLYRQIITAGTHSAASIKIAEAAKIVENTQRDVNIALMNEFAKIFDLLDVDTNSVIDAACTKWNFQNFRPGFVGGHCIGVDPYYLVHESSRKGYFPDIINHSRTLNESMPHFVAEKYFTSLAKIGINDTSRTLIVGITFKENCPDLRNSKSLDLFKRLTDLNLTVEVADSIADPDECLKEYNITLKEDFCGTLYDGIIITVGHEYVASAGIEYWRSLLKPNGIFFDLKSIFSNIESDYSF